MLKREYDPYQQQQHLITAKYKLKHMALAYSAGSESTGPQESSQLEVSLRGQQNLSVPYHWGFVKMLSFIRENSVFLMVNGVQEKGGIWLCLMWFLLKANAKLLSDT